ncbi:MAG: hypothetical protein ACFCD0_27735 [Gemmataceae bacterium]
MAKTRRLQQLTVVGYQPEQLTQLLTSLLESEGKDKSQQVVMKLQRSRFEPGSQGLLSPLAAQANDLSKTPTPTPKTTTRDIAYAHDKKYDWVQGVIQQSSQGIRLRYASIDERDKYGGSVTLVGVEKDMSLVDGNKVLVYGRFVNPSNSTIAPLYHVDSVRPIPQQ